MTPAPAAAVTPEQRAFFAANGFVRLGRVCAPRELEAIGAAVAAIQAGVAHRRVAGTSRIDVSADGSGALVLLNGFARVDAVLAAHARDPDLTSAAAALLSTTELRLLEDQVIVKPPRPSGRIHWHQDCSYWPLTPPDHVSCWLALDAATETSGSIQYVPGSHRDERRFASIRLASGRPRDHEDLPAIPPDPRAEGYECVTVELEPGEVVAHHSRTWHGSAPNRAAHERRAVVVRYAPAGARVDGRRRALHAPRELAELADGAELGGDAFPVVWRRGG